jgi:outer membrane protein assembly factor BamA
MIVAEALSHPSLRSGWGTRVVRIRCGALAGKDCRGPSLVALAQDDTARDIGAMLRPDLSRRSSRFKLSCAGVQRPYYAMRYLPALLLLFAVCSAAASLGAAPQSNRGVASFVLKRISTSGSRRYGENDIIKATGLKLGSKVTSGDLQEAANRLGQSGVFAQVSYRYDGDTATYTVADAEQVVPASFENFVWFTDEDLMKRVHDSVPLFVGQVPVNGTLSDQITAALDAVVKEKGVQGHVVAMPESTLAGQYVAVQFRIDGVNAKIAELRFPGARADHIALLESATHRLIGQDYLQSGTAAALKLDCPPVYGKLGFLKAEFGLAKPVVVKDDPANPGIAVEVPVQEGDQYTFAGATWSGASAIPAAELAKTIDLKPGAPADTTQLGKDVALAKELYGRQGYMNAQIKTTATLDNEKHTAVFNLDVNEGPLYHMGKLEVQNLDPQRADLVKRVWEMKEGSVYDASYPTAFLKKHPRELPSLNGWAYRFTQTIHDDTHVVDLVLRFDKFQQQAR